MISLILNSVALKVLKVLRRTRLRLRFFVCVPFALEESPCAAWENCRLTSILNIFSEFYMLHVQVFSCSWSSSGSEHLRPVTGQSFDLLPACESRSPNLFIAFPHWHPRRAFPGTDLDTVHLRWWVVLRSDELSRLRDVVNVMLVTPTVLSALSEVNLHPADSAYYTPVGEMVK